MSYQSGNVGVHRAQGSLFARCFFQPHNKPNHQAPSIQKTHGTLSPALLVVTENLGVGAVLKANLTAFLRAPGYGCLPQFRRVPLYQETKD